MAAAAAAAAGEEDEFGREACSRPSCAATLAPGSSTCSARAGSPTDMVSDAGAAPYAIG